VIFDIETAADPARAKLLLPAFEEKDVAVGNIKDPEKIREKIAARRISHEANWLEEAALRPETGRVLAIGVLPHQDDPAIIFHLHESDELDVLHNFWDFLESSQRMNGRPFIGWSIFHFDLPYLIIRSRILGVAVPPLLRQGRFFSPTRFIDLQDEWLLGRPRSEVPHSLDYVARALGCGGKSGEGKDFGALYAVDEAAALAYLRNDLLITRAVADKLKLL
jgi:Predicted 3'-5' exonuclease related to the exonuclease domain of PolB